MTGALAGDIIGSVYEWNNIKTKDFGLFSKECFFTDDSVLTVALADSILTGKPYVENLVRFHDLYPDAGYGTSFDRWARSTRHEPYGSWGNGAAMRISPVGFAFDDLESVMRNAAAFTVITHNHPEGMRGAQATAAAIFLARTGSSIGEIKDHVESIFGYDLSLHVDDIRPAYGFDESSQGTVPQAITAFLDSTGFEDAIRNAISLGGDSDTLACITGGIAQAYYGGVPAPIESMVYAKLDARLGDITMRFMEKR